MIRYIDNLYVTDKLENKKNSIMRKLRLGIGMVSVNVITMASNETDVFDIIPAAMFKSYKLRHSDLLVVGLAESKKAAFLLVEKIIEEHFELTGKYSNLREDFLELMVQMHYQR